MLVHLLLLQQDSSMSISLLLPFVSFLHSILTDIGLIPLRVMITIQIGFSLVLLSLFLSYLVHVLSLNLSQNLLFLWWGLKHSSHFEVYMNIFCLILLFSNNLYLF